MNEFDPLFFCLVLPCIMLCSLSPVLAILVYAGWQSRRRQAEQANLTARLTKEALDATRLPVKYASHERFRKLLKIFPWNEWGVFQLTADGGSFYRFGQAAGEGERTLQIIQFPAAETRIQPVKRDLFRNSTTSWVILEHRGVAHYFAAETGMTVFGSKRKAEEMRALMRQHFPEA